MPFVLMAHKLSTLALLYTEIIIEIGNATIPFSVSHRLLTSDFLNPIHWCISFHVNSFRTSRENPCTIFHNCNCDREICRIKPICQVPSSSHLSVHLFQCLTSIDWSTDLLRHFEPNSCSVYFVIVCALIQQETSNKTSHTWTIDCFAYMWA